MKKLIPFAAFLVLLSCQKSEVPVDPGPTIEAESEIFAITQVSEEAYEVTTESKGMAFFSQTGDVVTLTIELTGFEPNSSHAAHIHNGTITLPGRHWNQQSFYAFCNERSLGELWGKPFAGDIGNVEVDSNGNGTFSIQTDLWALNSGDEKDIQEKVIIIHAQPENFAVECDPNHSHDHPHNNQKIAGGTIVITSEIEKNMQATTMTQFPDFTICN